DLSARLIAPGDGLSLVLGETLWTVASDPAADLPSPRGPAAACEKARVRSLEPTGRADAYRIKIDAPEADCPLTIATNYADDLSARARLSDGSERELRVFPAYGALTGVLVPAGAQEIAFEAHPDLPLWARIFGLLGLALSALLMTLVKPGYGT